VTCFGTTIGLVQIAALLSAFAADMAKAGGPQLGRLI
jgi:hypothetical protein